MALAEPRLQNGNLTPDADFPGKQQLQLAACLSRALQ
jgi:hypothetical protein